MKKFLLGIISAVFACCALCGAVALSACGKKSPPRKGVGVSEFQGYGNDIDYRFSVTSEEECPAGDISEDRLYADYSLEQGKTYYIVLDITFHNFDWAGERYAVSTYLGDRNGFTSTLHEANTSDFDEQTVGDDDVIITRYGTPQNREEEKSYRVVYEVEMTDGVLLTASFEADSLGKSAAFAVGDGIGLELNQDGSSYSVKEFSAAYERLAVPYRFGDNMITAIAGGAFANNSTLRNLLLPATITSVGAGAFEGSATAIDWGEEPAITDIGYRAFYGYLGTEAVIPSCVNRIGAEAFSGCVNFEKITIPSGVTEINGDAFAGCNRAAGVYITDMAAWCNTEFTEESANPLYYVNRLYLNNVPVTKLEVPKETARISDYAFYGCSDLERVEIGAGGALTRIGESAFGDCDGLSGVYITDMETWCNIEFADLYANPLYYAQNLYLDGSPVNSLEVPADVEAVNSYAFINLAITGAALREGVDCIGDYAFYCCANLAGIEIPDSVTQIGEGAFYGCSALESVVLGADGGLTSIGEGAFYNCTLLAGIDIPAGVTGIGGAAFKGCAKLARVDFAANSALATLGEEAFLGCSQLKNIAVPPGVTYLGRLAFGGCENLVSLSTPFAGPCVDGYYYDFVDLFGEKNYNVYNPAVVPAGLKTVEITGGGTIRDGAFSLCANIERIIIGENVTAIGDGAFEGCKGLKNVDFADGSNLAAIGARAFEQCSGLTGIKIPSSVVSIGEGAFLGCGDIAAVNIEDIAAWCGIDFYNETANPLFFTQNFYLNGAPVTGIEITSGTDHIGSYAFYGYTKLTSAVIGEGVTRVGDYAFRGCTNLKSAVLPQSVESIGYGVFSNCNNLESVTLPFVGDGFNRTYFSYFFGANYSGDSRYVPDSLKNVILLGGERIDDGAFGDCGYIESITLPSCVNYMGEDAFKGCNGLSDVYITDMAAWCGTEFANEYANPLYYAKNLYLEGNPVTVLDLPSEVKEIKNYAFINLAITGAELREGIDSIGDCAFYNCASLKSVNIPDSVTKIGAGAFAVDFSGEGTGLEEITFGDGSQLRTIGEYAFSNCGSLAGITIPKHVISIGDGAFEYCYKLAEVINLSDLPIRIGDEGFGGVAKYALSVTDSLSDKKITERDGYTFFEDGGKVYMTGYTGSDTKLQLPADFDGTAYAINNYAFYGNDRITSVSVPDGVTSIGFAAFGGCNSLESMTLPFVGDGISQTHFGYIFGAKEYGYEGARANVPDSLQTVVITGGERIDDYAFAYCAMAEITLPESIITIGDYAFEYCAPSHLTIPASVTSIGYEAFFYSGLESIDFAPGSRLGSIGGSAFLWCTALKSAQLPDSLTELGAFAFRFCNNLASVEIGADSKLETICDGAFSYCGIESVTIPASVTYIGKGAFEGCQSLKEVAFENRSGWKISEKEDMTGAVAVTPDGDPAQNAILLTEDYSSYYWKRS